MAQDCTLTNSSSDAKIIAQQLFLGATINSFNFSLGWGPSSSNLSVELVNDFGSIGDCNITSNPNLDVFQLKNSNIYDNDNHYYNCLGNNCYADEYGLDYDPNRGDKPSKEKRIPGKVYHYISPGGDLVSRYWRKHDPGFFGAGTLIDPNGAFNPRYSNNKLFPYKYNIIGVPVMFRYGYFTFGGIIKSWDAQINGVSLGTSAFDIFNSSVTYNVSIASADTLLENCKVILDKYSGSVFGSIQKKYNRRSNKLYWSIG